MIFHANYPLKMVFIMSSESVSIRIDKVFYDYAKRIAKAEHRTISSQIEFWAKVGKCALENPDLPIEFVKDILIAQQEPTEIFVLESTHV